MANQTEQIQVRKAAEAFDLSSEKKLCAEPIGVALSTPRGRFELHWCERVACFLGKSASLMVEYTNIAAMFELPLLKEKKRLLVLQLHTPVPYMRSNLQQIVMALPEDQKQICVAQPVKPLPESLQGSAVDVLSAGFEAVTSQVTAKPSPKTYRNCAGGLSLKSYMKANDGSLFLFRVGMWFTKPVTFVQAQQIEAYELTQTGRAFEINLLLKSGKKVDFSMIDVAEYEGVHKYFKKMQTKGLICAESAATDEEEPEAEGEGAAAEDQEENSESETESEYDPDAPDSSDEDEDGQDESEDEGQDEGEDEQPATKKQKKK
eukprot:TRINITY_DN13551_c0_g1_i2.p1 TRINITY_DN13551_c0_g1~~TRINITY_DN13551_c0_g1_i2.p1  ORF type:complete len:319 (-),score=101.11 TRINITY_DN13551_c0_g1_i2:204-1160(-)